MTKTLKSRASSFWVAIMIVGILGCLAGVAYTFYMIQQEAGQEGEQEPQEAGEEETQASAGTSEDKPETPLEPGSESEAVDEFDQLGSTPDESAEESGSESLPEAGAEPGRSKPIPLMDQMLDQVEGDPSDLLRNQFMMEEYRIMQSNRGMMMETRPW